MSGPKSDFGVDIGACTITLEEYRRRAADIEASGGPKHHVIHQPNTNQRKGQ